MDQATEGNFATENQETAPGSSSDGVYQVMDSNEIVVDVVSDIQSKRMKNETENARSEIPKDKNREITVATVPERKTLKRKDVHPPSSNGVTEVVDTNEKVLDVVPDMQSKRMNNKTGNAKSEIPKDKNKEITVASVPERKSLKKKDVHSPSSNRVTEVVDTNKNVLDVVPVMQSKRMKNETGNAKSKIPKDKNKEITVASVPERKSLKRKYVHSPSSNGVTKVADTDKNVLDVVPDMQSKSMKNKTANKKSKIQKHKTKETTLVSQSNRENLKRKVAHPPTSEMVMDSIKVLKKRNGASFEDIGKYMEERYTVNMKRLKYHAEKFLQKGADNGLLEKIDRGGAGIRFKIKQSKNIKKDSKNLAKKERKVKPEKKMASTKKQVKK